MSTKSTLKEVHKSEIEERSEEELLEEEIKNPVSYTHLTLPTTFGV